MIYDSPEWHRLLREGRMRYRWQEGERRKYLVAGQRWSYGGRSGWHYVLLNPWERVLHGKGEQW